MFYIATGDTAYAMDHSMDIMYGMTCSDDNIVDVDDCFEIDYASMDDVEREYVAHVAYHLQQIAKLTEEHREVFVK
jgi:hypothetical protein